MYGGFVQCPSGGVRWGARRPGVCSLPGKRGHGVGDTRRNVRVVATAAPVEVREEDFGREVLEAELPVLVDFYAAWCGPCKLVAPLMDWAATEFEGKLKVVKIDTEDNKSFVNRYGIHGLPTFAVFKNGEAFGVQEGALGKDGLKRYIETHTSLVASVKE